MKNKWQTRFMCYYITYNKSNKRKSYHATWFRCNVCGHFMYLTSDKKDLYFLARLFTHDLLLKKYFAACSRNCVAKGIALGITR